MYNLINPACDYSKISVKKYKVGNENIPIAIVINAIIFILSHLVASGSDEKIMIFNSVAEGKSRMPLKRTEVNQLGQIVISLWKNNDYDQSLIPVGLKTGDAAVYASFRSNGEAKYEVWKDGPSGFLALQKVIKDGQDYTQRSSIYSKINTIELNFAHSFTTHDYKKNESALSNIYRGIRGLEFIHKNKPTRFSPTKILATNRSFKSLLEIFCIEAKLLPEQVKSPLVKTRTFEADQLLVQLHKPEKTYHMERGNNLVDIEDLTINSVRKIAEAMIIWIKKNLKSNGRMVYKYWPSRGTESVNNNMIRQWMATVCMNRICKVKEDKTFYSRVTENIRYNLSEWYWQNNGHGLIEYKGKVKLGALALATLSIVEHPERAKFKRYEQGMIKTIDSLWNEDGSFTTFYKSPNIRRKDSNANFYPGEALVLWAELYEKSKDPRLLERFMKAFKFYRSWHLENRNPAFIPWHTQAYFNVWKTTRDKELQDFVFQMNDWLLDIQQWESIKHFPDTQGRFYDPSRPFGPPHASSTGIYLEGLIDAHQLAKMIGDTKRQENYRRAIVRGLRSIMQLIFIDEVDMFYVSKRDSVYGGVRTTVYDNEIRVDNVQHNLMGILKILDVFEEGDYRP